MKRSLPRLSPETQALLAAEREIPKVSEAMRRHALLRARTALWHVRRDASVGASPAPARRLWLKAAIAAVSAGGLSYAGLALTSNPHDQVAAPQPPRIESNVEGPEATVVEATCAGENCNRGFVETAAAAPPTVKNPPAVFSPKATKLTRARTSSSAASGPPVPADIELLDAARRSLGARDYQGALRRLRRHQQLFADSPLAEERDALRIRALQGAGRSSAAKRAASGFDQSHPNSVLRPSLSQPKSDAD